MNKEPKNHLNSFDFCLRKAIALHVFSKNSDETLSEFAKAIDTTQPTLSKWMSRETDRQGRITPSLESRHVPSASQILLASAYLSIPVIEMIDEAIKGEEKQPLIPLNILERIKRLSKDLHDKSMVSLPKHYERRTPDYLKKIKRTGNSRYIGFFLQDKNVEHLIVETYEPYESGSVPMTARIIGKAGNPYRGNVVSPPGNDHLYFYIRQEDGKNDRGIMVFYIDDDMQDTYKCGSGILLSTDRKTGTLRLQWVVIIRVGESFPPISTDTMVILQEIQAREHEINQEDREYEKYLVEIDTVIKPILEEDIPESQGSHIIFDNLKTRQEELYNVYKALWFDKRKMAEKRVEFAKIQYEKALEELSRYN